MNELDVYDTGSYFRLLSAEDTEVRLILAGIKSDLIQYRAVSFGNNDGFGSAKIGSQLLSGPHEVLTDGVLLGYIPNAVPGIRQFKSEFSNALNWCISSVLTRFPEADLITAKESLAIAEENGIDVRRITVMGTYLETRKRIPTKQSKALIKTVILPQFFNAPMIMWQRFCSKKRNPVR